MPISINGTHNSAGLYTRAAIHGPTKDGKAMTRT